MSSRWTLPSMQRAARACLLVIVASCTIASAAAPGQPILTDPRALDAQTRTLYERVVRTLDTWNGDAAWLADVEALADQVAAKEPRFVPIQAERARLTLMKSNFVREGTPNRLVLSALDMLVTVNKRAPQYARAYVLAGHANVVLGRYDAAKVALDRARALKSDDPWLQYNYSDLYGQTGRYEKAVSYAASAILAGHKSDRVLRGALYQLDKFLPRLEVGGAASQVGETLFRGIKDEGERMDLVGALIKGSGRSPRILGIAETMLDLQRHRTPNLPDINVLLAQMALESGTRFLRDGIPRYAPPSLAMAQQLLANTPVTPRTRDKVFDLNTTMAFSMEDFGASYRLIENATDVSKNLVDEKRATWLYLTGDFVASVDLMQDLVLRDRKYSNHPVLLMGQTALGKTDKYISTAKQAMESANFSAISMGNYAGILLHTANDPDGAIDYGERALQKSAYGVLKATTALAHLVKAARLKTDGDTVRSNIHLARAGEIGFDEEYLLSVCRRHCAELRVALSLRELKNNAAK